MGNRDFTQGQGVSKSLVKVSAKSGNFVLRLPQIILLHGFVSEASWVSLIHGQNSHPQSQWKLLNSQWKVRDFFLFRWVATLTQIHRIHRENLTYNRQSCLTPNLDGNPFLTGNQELITQLLYIFRGLRLPSDDSFLRWVPYGNWLWSTTSTERGGNRWQVRMIFVWFSACRNEMQHWFRKTTLNHAGVALIDCVNGQDSLLS